MLRSQILQAFKQGVVVVEDGSRVQQGGTYENPNNSRPMSIRVSIIGFWKTIEKAPDGFLHPDKKRVSSAKAGDQYHAWVPLTLMSPDLEKSRLHCLAAILP